MRFPNVKRFLLYFDQQIWVLFIGTLVSSFGGSMVMIFFSPYLLRMGVSASIIGLGITLSVGFGAISELISGSICDFLGRKKLIVFGLASGSILLTIMGLTTSPFLLILLNVLCGISFAILTPSVNAIVADIFQNNRRVEAYGLLKVAFNAGYGIGAIVGGFLAAFSYPLLFFIDAICSAIYFIIVLLFLRESAPISSKETFGFLQTTKEYIVIAKDRLFLLFSLYSLLLWFGYSQSMTPFSIYSIKYIGINESQLGILWSINTWIIVCFQILISRFIKKFHIMQIMIMGSLLYSISFLIIPFLRDFKTIIIFIVLLTLSELVISPTLSAGVAMFAKKERRGRYMGLFGSLRSFGWSIGPFIGCLTIDFLQNKHILWYSICILGLFLAIAYFRLGLMLKNQKAM